MIAAEATAAHEEAALLYPYLNDVEWRLSNLYYILVKDESDENDEGLVLKFSPNRAQRRLLRKLHTRNLILKARQLGMTTLIAILWLDTALFNPSPMFLGIIAHEREAAEGIFRDKVIFAYERLPELVKQMAPIRSKNKTEVVFDHNGATLKVATSVRSGTIHRLHVSEMGKIAAKYPAKAREVIAGSIPAVPTGGMLVIESTAEGQDGYFYEYVRKAREHAERALPLSRKDYRLHFFAWWEAPEYRLEDHRCVFTPRDLEYFAQVEAKIGRPLDEAQRAWYVTTRDVDFAGEWPLMWQEYPSYPDEAFQISTDGCYYAAQLAAVRKAGRIVADMPIERGIPVYTFWDLGRGDMTALWLMQKVGLQHRWIGYYENTGEELDHYADWLMQRKLIYAAHYLPHDADTKRLGQSADTNKSQKEMLQALLPGHRIRVVPRISNLQSGIQQTRRALGSSWFHEAECAQGLKRLAGYKKAWDQTRGRWKDDEDQTDDNHGADAFRQFAQKLAAGERFGGGDASDDVAVPSGTVGSGRWAARRARRGSGMAA